LARRRKQKGTLLPKMIGLAVLVNAVLLPLLATMGVFKPKKGGMIEVKLIKLPPLEKKKKLAQKTPPKKQVAKAKPRPVERQAARREPIRVVPSQPHIALAKPTSTGSGAAAQGGGKTGVVPAGPAGGTVATQPPPAQQQPPPTQPAAPPPAQPVPVTPTPAPHQPVYAEAEPLNRPQPTLPDDLRDQDLHTLFMGLFTIHLDGTASVKMIQSTGNPTLDDLALDAARKWTFKPGMKDGQPIESFLRLQVNFDVS
jgi:TonB family protein